MKKRLPSLLAAVAIFAAICWFSACKKDKVATDINVLAYAPSASVQGSSQGDWSAKWWQWALALPCAVNPIFDPTGANASINQNGPVFFLAGNNGGPVTRNVTIPAGKDIFFPVMNVIIDYPCPDTAFHTAPGQTLEQLLKSYSWVADSVDVLEITLDGTTLRDPFHYRVKSELFKFTGSLDVVPCFGDPCITGTEQDGWSDGYWIALKSLKKGQHTLHFHGAVTNWNWIQDVTYNLTVE